MSKTARENFETLLSPLIPELAEKILKSPQTWCERSLVSFWAKLLHLTEHEQSVLRRAVTGHIVTQVLLPESPSYDDLMRARKKLRAHVRDSWNRVKAIWVGLDALAQFYGIPIGSRDFRFSAALMHCLALTERLESWFKWVTCHISAWCLSRGGDEDEFPPHAFPGLHPMWIWGGQRRWLKRAVPLNRRGSPWAAQVGFSVLQTKRSALAVSDELIRRAVVDHRDALSQPTSPAPAALEEAVRRTVREVFGGLEFHSRTPIPSTSAHYSSSRKHGGAMGVLAPRWNNLRCSGGYLERMIEVRPGEVLEVRAALPQEEIDFQYKTLEVREENVVRPSPVLEALKVRMITCGSEERYWRAHSLARDIRRHLGRHPTFALTVGQPLESVLPVVLGRLSRCESRDAEPPSLIVSADYKAATDGLNWSLSQAALREIFACGGRLDWADYEADLISHTLNYEMLEEEESIRTQQNGQLMGSPLSFPILCVVNAAVTRFLLEKTRCRQLTLNQCGMLVNGDDLLFTLRDRAQYDDWKEVVSSAGLKPSPGKNYISRSIAVINSQCYTVSYNDPVFGLSEPYRHAVVTPVHHLAVGNLRGQGRVLEKRAKLLEQMGRPIAMGDNINVLCERAGPRAADAFSLLLRLNDNFRGVPCVDWFLPTHLGGLGVFPRFRKSSAPSLRKLIWADFLLRESRSFKAWVETEREVSFGSHVRSCSEAEFLRRAGYEQGYGIKCNSITGRAEGSVRRTTEGVGGGSSKVEGGNNQVSGTASYQRLSLGVAALASERRAWTPRRDIEKVCRLPDPTWEVLHEVPCSGGNDGCARSRSASLLDETCPPLPKCFRADSFLHEDTWAEDGVAETRTEATKVTFRPFTRLWVKAQKESPRVREMRTLSQDQLLLGEILIWSCSYDWMIKPNRAKQKTPQ